jgi:hypothetical protein
MKIKNHLLRNGATGLVLLLLFSGFTAAMAESVGGQEGASKPRPEIPRLTEAEKEKAEEIVLNDPGIQEILSGKDYRISAVGVSHEGSVKTGAMVEVILDKNYWIESEQEWGQKLLVFVDLENDRVGGITPIAGRGPKAPASIWRFFPPSVLMVLAGLAVLGFLTLRFKKGVEVLAWATAYFLVSYTYYFREYTAVLFPLIIGFIFFWPTFLSKTLLGVPIYLLGVSASFAALLFARYRLELGGWKLIGLYALPHPLIIGLFQAYRSAFYHATDTPWFGWLLYGVFAYLTFIAVAYVVSKAFGEVVRRV